MNTVTTPSRFQRLISIALAGIFSFGLPELSVAADSFAPLKVTVRFDDLEISRPQGAVALYSRIRSAAEKVCSPFEGPGLWAKAHLDACIHKAVADAVIAVNEPALLAVHCAKLGKTQPVRVTSLQNP